MLKTRHRFRLCGTVATLADRNDAVDGSTPAPLIIFIRNFSIFSFSFFVNDSPFFLSRCLFCCIFCFLLIFFPLVPSNKTERGKKVQRFFSLSSVVFLLSCFFSDKINVIFFCNLLFPLLFVQNSFFPLSSD